MRVRTGQLVADSPTKSRELSGRLNRNSYSVYRLYVDAEHRLLRVQRTLRTFLDGRDEFRVTQIADVFVEIPL